MFGLSKFFRIYNLFAEKFSMWNLLQNIMPINKTRCEDFGKQFSGYNILDFKFIIVQMILNRLTTPFSKT